MMPRLFRENNCFIWTTDNFTVHHDPSTHVFVISPLYHGIYSPLGRVCIRIQMESDKESNTYSGITEHFLRVTALNKKTFEMALTDETLLMLDIKYPGIRYLTCDRSTEYILRLYNVSWCIHKRNNHIIDIGDNA